MLIRGPLDAVCDAWEPGKVLASAAMAVDGWRYHSDNKALSTGMYAYEPSEGLLNAVLQYAKSHPKPQYAADQNAFSEYMNETRPQDVVLLHNHYHANTRAHHYAPDIWAEVDGDDAALWHFAGPKPWLTDFQRCQHGPWAQMFNEWRKTANGLGLGPYPLLGV